MKKQIILSLAMFASLYAENANEAGNALGSQLSSYFKSNQNTAINTLTNDGELTSVDGKQKANVKLVCDESKSGEFLNINYTGTSDINIQIKFDKNVDGNFDKVWNFAGISGICTQGLIKCDKDTWNNCEYFQYSFGSDINLVKTSMDNLNGCYCINNSCGGIAGKNRDKILYDIAGPIYSALTQNTSLVISKANNVNGALSYKGQDYSTCDNYGEVSQVNGNSDLEVLAKEQAQKDKKNDNSAYSVFYKGTDNEEGRNDKAFDEKIKKDFIDVDKNVKANESKNKLDFSYVENGKSNQGSLQTSDKIDAKFCEVSIAKTDTSAFNDGTNRENSTNNTTVYESEIRECVDNYNKCPIKNSNESIKHNCGKINDMGEALAQLSALDEASKDMICSKK
ncbi:hypothetical protein CHLV4142_03670 [Campylobacter helveticus]|uniref:Conjugal transfer protein TraN n=1 Tax=Campylobacter helveticus TaxID=28898 RepID=A0ABY3L239_9BACT|nr:hypothetical protein [Campylobacter helveticus]MCR2039242.1 hypothetical protein [Campylobacter helveticus]TXK57552.1 hypothetical protein FVD16_04840 [Campylobacter helveticus]